MCQFIARLREDLELEWIRVLCSRRRWTTLLDTLDHMAYSMVCIFLSGMRLGHQLKGLTAHVETRSLRTF